LPTVVVPPVDLVIEPVEKPFDIFAQLGIERQTVIDGPLDIPSEVHMYILFTVPKIKQEPIAWWAKHHLEFPRLAYLACKYLCIPATSVSSELVFSKSGEIVEKRRTRLASTNVDKLMFLSDNNKL